jgi:hypothetical protein
VPRKTTILTRSSERGELFGQLVEHALVEGVAAIRPT